MNVLSLFDGMSCAQIALERVGIKVEEYYASELDKYAIKVTQANYPDTIQLGDVCDIDGGELPKIDLLIGGSPCQGFSFAGKQLNFDDPRSKLFFEYVRVLKELTAVNPNIKFLLENVKMKKEYEDVISGALGVKPISINSNLVSAQNRKRLYWTNIKGLTQPDDREILLCEIVDGLVDRDKSHCLDANYYKGGNDHQYFNKSRRQLVFLAGLKKGLRLLDGKFLSRNFREGSRVYSFNGKAATLTAKSKGGEGGYSGLYGEFQGSELFYRKLTPTECERLQTVPDNYTNHVSNTQRYKMLGNGFTVNVIAHILEGLK